MRTGKAWSLAFIGAMPLMLCFVLAIGVERANAGIRTWTSTGPSAALVGAIAVDPTDPNIVYVSTGAAGGLWRTIDGGASWTKVRSNGAVSIAIDPTTPSKIFVADAAGIWKSTDSGQTWAFQFFSFQSNGLDVAFSADGSIAYAMLNSPQSSTISWLYKSTDGGATWVNTTGQSNMSSVPQDMDMLAIDPTDASTLYVVGTFQTYGTLRKSTNAGLTFGSELDPATFTSQGVQTGGSGKRWIAVSPSSHNTLYAGTTSGVKKSTDGGATWSTTAFGTDAFRVWVSPASANVVYARGSTTAGSSFVRSTDGGATWQPANIGSYSSIASAMAWAPSAPTTVYAGTHSGIFRSTDGGATWSNVTSNVGHAFASDVRVVGNDIYAGTLGAGVFSSPDGGLTWSSKSGGLPGVDIESLASAPGQLWATTNNGIFESLNGGVTWFETDSGIPAASSGARPTTLLAHAAVTSGSTTQNFLYAMAPFSGLYKSSNGGQTWTAVTVNGSNFFPSAIAIDPSQQTHVWAGTSASLYRSSDSGATWTALAAPSTALLQAIAVDPTDATHIFACYETAGVYRSLDSGATWTKLTTASNQVKDIEIDTVSGAIFIATGVGVERSVDGGSSWTTLAGLGQTGKHIAVRRTTSGLTVYASAFAGSGVSSYTYPAPTLTRPSVPDLTAGVASTVDVGTLSDGSGEGPWQVNVDWGDGTTPDTFVANTAGGLGTRSHTYASGGLYTSYTTVTNALGLSADSDLISIAVKGQSTTTVSGPSTSNYGDVVTFTVTVASVGNSSFPPSGFVKAAVDGTDLGAFYTLTNGQTTLSLGSAWLTIGQHEITATYQGDFLNLTSSGSLTHTVSSRDTTTAISTSATSTVYGEPLTLTATVTAVAANAGTPTGTVTFLDGTTAVGSGSLNGAGVATFMTTLLDVGGHSLSATFTGNATFNASASSTASVTVSQAATLTTVTADVTPSVFGQAVTFTAEVTVPSPGGGTPTGGVQFYVDGAPSGAAVPLSSAHASAVFGGLTVGTHSIGATYGGDTRHVGSTSSLSQVVARADTGATISASPSITVAGQAYAVTVTIAPVPPGAGTASGAITVSEGAASCTATLGSGAATCSITSATAGQKSIAFSYSGDGNFKPTTGTAMHQVDRSETVTALASSAASSAPAQAVSFTASVGARAPGAGSPTGAVMFQVDGVALGPAMPVVAGVARSLSTQALSVGSHLVTATYSGDANFTASAASFTQVVSFGTCMLYDQTKVWNGGSTIPIKVALCDAFGNDISNSATVLTAGRLTLVNTDVGAASASGNANPDNDFRFDVSLGPSGGYIYNLSTKGLAPGVYSLSFTVTADPVAHTLQFRIR